MPTGIKFIPSLLNGISSVGVGLSTIIGPTGPAGAFGGPQGLQGISGTNGVQGFQGIAGTIGIDGVQGLKGDTGEGFKVFATSYSYTGLNSIIATGGNVGEFVLITGGDLFVYSGTGSGTTGPNISYSYAGDITDESKLIGVQGFQGLAGTTGTNGVQGVQGFSSTGTQGLQGLVGFQGIAGAAVGSLANVKMSFTRTVDSPGVSNTGNRLYAFSGATGVFNTPSSNITFTPSNGRFTVSEQGDYYFDTRLIVQSTQSPDQVMFDVHLNTGTVYSYRHTVYGIVSPAPMPIGLYLPMNAGDYVHLSCYSTGTAGPITVKAGSTMNLYRMTNGPTGAQGSIGIQGPTGSVGPFSGYAKLYTYSSTTGASNPGSGYLRLSRPWNDQTQGNVDIFVSVNDANGRESSGWWNSFLTYGSSGYYGTINMQAVSDPSRRWLGQVINVVNSGGSPLYYTITATYSDYDNVVYNGENIIVSFVGAGRIGQTGVQGFQGSLGFQGLQGFQGLIGLQGVQGQTGVQGFQGSIGFQGIQGLQGLQGNQGVQGLQGIQGNIGIQGTPGPTGTLSGTVTFTQGSSIPVNADVNNYSISDGTIFSMTGSGGFSFNGIANGLIGRFIVLINNSAGNITFKQENAGSTASNRFSLSTSQITVGIDSTITFIYGTTSIGNRWLCIAKQ